MHELNLLRLKNIPILQQLQLEEALLRADDRNWCLINEGSPPAIVMGISGKPESLVHLDQTSLPIIRRFSGGGTVVVDENTLFVTLLGNHNLLPCEPYPCPIMRWTADLYRPMLAGHPFSLRENDYVIGEKKFGGNAQSLIRGRFLHHSTLLWDYLPSRMDCLKMPERRPKYRGERPHSDFICTLKALSLYPSISELADSVELNLMKGLKINRVSIKEAEDLLVKDHRKATTLIK